MSQVDTDDGGCCGCLLLCFVIPVLIGVAIFMFKLGVDVARWFVSLV